MSEKDFHPISDDKKISSLPATIPEISPEESLAKEHHQHGNDLLSKFMEDTRKSNPGDDLQKLEEITQAYRDALLNYPASHPSRWNVTNNLAACYMTMFRLTKDIEVLEEAISTQRQLLRIAESTSNRISALSNLGISLDLRYKHFKTIENINEAIELHREALSLSGYAGSNSKLCLRVLTNELFSRFEDTRSINDLDEAIRHHRLAASEITNEAERMSSLGWIGHYLYLRFEYSSDLGNLEESIRNLSDVVEFEENSGAEVNHQSVNTLAAAYLARSNNTGSVHDLEQGIELFRKALSLSNPDDDNYGSVLCNLGTALNTLYDKTGNRDSLEESIAMIENALEFIPPGHLKRSSTMAALASSFMDLFVGFGDPQRLDTSIALNEEALEIAPNAEDRLMVLCNLAHGLDVRYMKTGNNWDIDNSIAYSREAIEVSKSLGKRVDNLVKAYENLGSSLSSRFQRTGNISDIQESTEVHRISISLLPPDHPAQYTSIARLATSIMIRFEILGAIEDLEEAISLKRQAIEAHNAPDSLKYSLFDSLALALNTRSGTLGTMHDLDEAITLQRFAVLHCPPEHVQRSYFLNNLATTIFARYNHGKDIHDLNDAIAINYQALELRPAEHPLRWKTLHNIAAGLNARFENLRDDEDLRRAIDLFYEATTLVAEDNPVFSLLILNSAAALYNRFELTRNINDLHSLMDLYFVALKHIPDGHPVESDIYLQIGAKFLIVCRLSPRTDREIIENNAFSLMQQATEHVPAPPLARFKAAFEWVQFAHRHEHQTHLQAYQQCLTALERCLFFAPSLEAQQALLANIAPKSLASDAAAFAIAEGRPDLAIELLEQGRAILWSRLRGFRHSLQEVRNSSPVLADSLEQVTAALESFSLSADVVQSDDNQWRALKPDTIRDNRVLSDERERIIESIRELDGFHNFLKPVPYCALQEAASEGPVIYMNVSKHGIAALIVRAKDLPVCVPLPSVSIESLEELAGILAEAKELHSQQRMGTVLRTLWKDIVEPIVKRLLSLGVSLRSRIWWCPTSLLCQFPLHAAGPYKKNGKNLPDMFISSYVPSLAALVRARSAKTDTSKMSRFLAMGQTNTLPAVKDEILRIRDFGGYVTAIVDEDASPEAVLEHLRTHKWAHFACHGFQHPDKPFNSFFQLHNEEPLTLLDIIHADLPMAELAFLSACHTATGDLQKTPDEMIHLAAAMQFIGFRSVVGSLWEMYDNDGPVVVDAFYTEMLKDGWDMADFRNSAKALNHVIRMMREKKISLNRCVNFVHIGA